MGLCNYDGCLYDDELKIVQGWAKEVKYIRVLLPKEEEVYDRLMKGLLDWRGG